MVCDEGGKRPRRPSRRFVEGTGVGGTVGPVGGKRRLRAGQSAALKLRQRGARSGGERHRTGGGAFLTEKASSAGIERGAASGDPRAAAGAGGQLRREPRRVQGPELEGAQERARRLGGAQAGEAIGDEAHQAAPP